MCTANENNFFMAWAMIGYLVLIVFGSILVTFLVFSANQLIGELIFKAYKQCEERKRLDDKRDEDLKLMAEMDARHRQRLKEIEDYRVAREAAHQKEQEAKLRLADFVMASGDTTPTPVPQ